MMSCNENKCMEIMSVTCTRHELMLKEYKTEWVSERERKAWLQSKWKFLCELELTLVCVFFFFFLLSSMLVHEIYDEEKSELFAMRKFFIFSYFDLTFLRHEENPGKLYLFYCISILFHFMWITLLCFFKNHLKNSPVSSGKISFLNPLNFIHHLLPFRLLAYFFSNGKSWKVILKNELKSEKFFHPQNKKSILWVKFDVKTPSSIRGNRLLILYCVEHIFIIRAGDACEV